MYIEFCCKQRNSRNLRLKTSGDMSYNSCKTGRSSKDGLASDLERHLGKLWSHEVQPANSGESFLAHFDMLTRGGRGRRWYEVLKKMLTGSLFLPSRRFLLNHVFAALALFFRFSFGCYSNGEQATEAWKRVVSGKLHKNQKWPIRNGRYLM